MQSIEFFAATEKYFAQMVDNLQNQVTTENNLGIIYDEWLGETRELARLLLQAHIDSRGNGDIGATIISQEKVKYRFEPNGRER